MIVNKQLYTSTNIKMMRRMADLSQKQLAELAGLHKETIIRFERGYFGMRESNLKKIIDILNEHGIYIEYIGNSISIKRIEPPNGGKNVHSRCF